MPDTMTTARFVPGEAAALAGFLTGERWPFHAGVPDRAKVLGQVDRGHWDGPSAATFWLDRDGTRAGVVRLFDLDDPTPMFDLRIAAAHRGRGLGGQAVAWLTGHLFTTLPGIRRIEATTRIDNHAMRAVLGRNGYVKEAHHRQAWPAPGGAVYDAIGYAILRPDWQSGTTTPVRWAD
jgi:RimJ/RimL family protein N-acetyltransferase